MTQTVAHVQPSADPAVDRRRPAATPRAMRVAYLTTEYPKASHTFIRREILELERRGHSVLRLSIRDAGDAIADPIDLEERRCTLQLLNQSKLAMIAGAVRTLASRPGRAIRAARAMWRLHRPSDRGLFRHIAYLIEAAALLPIVKRERIEHLHVHFGKNAASVAMLLRELGGPAFSVMIHGPGEFDAPVGHSLGDKVAAATFVTAISDYCAAQILRWSPTDQWWKVHVVRCTVDDSFFDDGAPVDATSNTFVCVGRLTPQKGQLLLVDAVARLVEEGFDVRLVLAGDGELRSQLEQRIALHDLQQRVTITGWIDGARVRELLREARALVLPSFAEGLPVVIMEALAMQRPVISTNIAAISELVRTGETGWLIPPGNVNALVDAMRQAMCADAGLLRQMGHRGSELVRKRHRTETEVEKLEHLIAAACQSRET